MIWTYAAKAYCIFEEVYMNIKRFSTMRYFVDTYFNCSMDWSDLEPLVEDFLMNENKDKIEAFRSEIELLHIYELEKRMSVKDIASILTGRGISDQKAESVIKLFNDKSVKNLKFRNICYFLNRYFRCHLGLFDLESLIEKFLAWESIRTLDKEIRITYKLNDPELVREIAYLENRIELFLMNENKERIETFRKEIEAVYTLIGNPELMREVAHSFGGDLRIPNKKAVCVIKLLYDNIERSKQ